MKYIYIYVEREREREKEGQRGEATNFVFSMSYLQKKQELQFGKLYKKQLAHLSSHETLYSQQGGGEPEGSENGNEKTAYLIRYVFF